MQNQGKKLAVLGAGPSGMMAAHCDPSNFINYHLVIPLTTKGNDYENGGLYIVKEKNHIKDGAVMMF